MGIHPKVLSRLFANAVESRWDTTTTLDRLGPFVVLGRLPDQVSADPAVVTRSGMIPNIKALHQAGVFLDMVCWPLGKSAAVRVGRDAGNDLVIPDVRVSHHHGCFHLGDVAALEDLGSSSGSTVNGERLGARQPRMLRDGDALSLGGFDLQFMGSVRLMDMLLNAGRSSTHAPQPL